MIIIIINIDKANNKIINTDKVIQSFNRDGIYGITMDGGKELLLTSDEFNQLVNALIAAEGE